MFVFTAAVICLTGFVTGYGTVKSAKGFAPAQGAIKFTRDHSSQDWGLDVGPWTDKVEVNPDSDWWSKWRATVAQDSVVYRKLKQLEGDKTACADHQAMLRNVQNKTWGIYVVNKWAVSSHERLEEQLHIADDTIQIKFTKLPDALPEGAPKEATTDEAAPAPQQETPMTE